jgi:lipoprotein-releasing system ATP-binding protein
MQNVILEVKGLNKHFYDPVDLHVLRNLNFKINQGEFVSIVGKSGCGKSTLLYVLSTMDTDYSGELFLHGKKITGLNGTELARIRNEKIGFVFQFHYLINEFSVIKNVMLPAMKLGKYKEREIEKRALQKLDTLGIVDLAHKSATQISGGEKQRVAIARALINDPEIIMGDEPTGNLDKHNSDVVFDIFSGLVKSFNQTLLIVTHDPEFAGKTSRIIEMEDGEIIRH